ncbi:N-acetylmuramoyl-L-alanine amidase [Nonomuraea fuscirosea]|uniref:N-acetylmuramoyl-L-alanine amidase n=1 Tax=Nonomuraea fuscirosea TaxID=1291556 RepID=UPI000D058873|nr:N-acetylmuramoyl-L-alanine amidase [Nonomuraea fuscirosea]
MSIKLVSRRTWRAETPTTAYTHVPGTEGVKIHYTGGHVDPRIVTDHEVCGTLVKAVQAEHMAGARAEPMIDIGHNLIACPHRRVFVGRGPYAMPEGNGPGLDGAHYSVLALVGSSGYTEPTELLLHAVRDAIEYLREHGNAGTDIRGHRDGHDTNCPGGPLTAWVAEGALRPPSPVVARPAFVQPTPRTTEVLVKNLPVLKPGDSHRHVKTMRAVLFARGFEPTNLHNATYDPADTDLVQKVTQFKSQHKIPVGVDPLVWDAACWEAALT